MIHSLTTLLNLSRRRELNKCAFSSRSRDLVFQFSRKDDTLFTTQLWECIFSASGWCPALVRGQGTCRVTRTSGNTSCHTHFTVCHIWRSLCQWQAGPMPRSDLHLTSSYLSPRLCLLYLFRSYRYGLAPFQVNHFCWRFISTFFIILYRLFIVPHKEEEAVAPLLTQ